MQITTKSRTTKINKIKMTKIIQMTAPGVGGRLREPIKPNKSREKNHQFKNRKVKSKDKICPMCGKLGVQNCTCGFMQY